MSKILKTSFYLYSHLTDCLVGSFLEVGVYLPYFRSKSSKNKLPEYWIKVNFQETYKYTLSFEKCLYIWQEIENLFPKNNPVLKVSDPTLPVSLEKLLKASTECFLGNKILEAKTFCGKHIREGSLHLLLKADIWMKGSFSTKPRIMNSYNMTNIRLLRQNGEKKQRYFWEIKSLLFFPRLDQPL